METPLFSDGLAHVDGGFTFAEKVNAGICFSTTRRKFILELNAPGIPPTCAAFSFKHADAGLPALFPGFKAPDGFVLHAARYSSFCDFELPDGTFSQERTAPVDDLWGAMDWMVFFEGKPRAFFLSGDTVMRLGNSLHSGEEGLYSTLTQCKGE